MLLKSFIFPFLLVGVALLLVAVYLPKNRSLKRFASEAEKSGQASSGILYMVTCFGVVIAGTCWYLFDGFLGELIALTVLPITCLGIILIFIISLAFRIFVKGIPIAMEAGRQMTPEQREKTAKFVWEAGKKISGKPS